MIWLNLGSLTLSKSDGGRCKLCPIVCSASTLLLLLLLPARRTRAERVECHLLLPGGGYESNPRQSFFTVSHFPFFYIRKASTRRTKSKIVLVRTCGSRKFHSIYASPLGMPKKRVLRPKKKEKTINFTKNWEPEREFFSTVLKFPWENKNTS